MLRILWACLTLLALVNATMAEVCWSPWAWPVTNSFRYENITTNQLLQKQQAGKRVTLDKNGDTQWGPVYLWADSYEDILITNRYVGTTVVNIVTQYINGLAQFPTTDQFGNPVIDYGPLPCDFPTVGLDGHPSSLGALWPEGFNFQPRELVAQQLADAVAEREICALGLFGLTNMPYNPVYYRRNISDPPSLSFGNANEYGRLLDFKLWFQNEMAGNGSHQWTRIEQGGNNFSDDSSADHWWNVTNLPATVGLPFNWAYWTPWRGLFDGGLSGPGRLYHVRTNWFRIVTNGVGTFCFPWTDTRGTVHNVCGTNREVVAVVWTNWQDASTFQYMSDQAPGFREGEYGYNLADRLVSRLTTFATDVGRATNGLLDGTSYDWPAIPPVVSETTETEDPTLGKGWQFYRKLWQDYSLVGTTVVCSVPVYARAYRQFNVQFGMPVVYTHPLTNNSCVMWNSSGSWLGDDEAYGLPVYGKQLDYNLDVYARAYRPEYRLVEQGNTAIDSYFWGGTIFPTEGAWTLIYSGPPYGDGHSNPITPPIDIQPDIWPDWPPEPTCATNYNTTYRGFWVYYGDVMAVVRVTNGWCYVDAPGAAEDRRVMRFNIPSGVRAVTVYGLRLSDTPVAIQATVIKPGATSARIFATAQTAGTTEDVMEITLSGFTTEPGYSVVILGET